MNTMLLKLYVKFQDLATREEGQDLVEYALVVALIAFGATAGMKACQGPEHGLQQHQHHPRLLHHVVFCPCVDTSTPAVSLLGRERHRTGQNTLPCKGIHT